MGQISVEITRLPGSLVSGNQHIDGTKEAVVSSLIQISKDCVGENIISDAFALGEDAAFDLQPDQFGLMSVSRSRTFSNALTGE